MTDFENIKLSLRLWPLLPLLPLFWISAELESAKGFIPVRLAHFRPDLLRSKMRVTKLRAQRLYITRRWLVCCTWSTKITCAMENRCKNGQDWSVWMRFLLRLPLSVRENMGQRMTCKRNNSVATQLQPGLYSPTGENCSLWCSRSIGTLGPLWSPAGLDRQ